MSSPLAEHLVPMEGRLRAAGEVALYLSEQGEGRPILFLHGLGWQHGLWRPQLARLSGRYRVLAGDNRGHGRSDKPTGPYSVRDMAEDWLRVLEGLGMDEWALVGFSQGGMIAQWIAALAPDRTRALALIGATCRTDSALRDVMEQRLAAAAQSTKTAAELAAQSIFSPAFMAREPGFIAAFVADRAAMPHEPLAAATRALYDFDVSGALASVTCPALVAVGTDDRLVPADAAREVARCLPRAEFQLIRDAGHMVMIEQPAEFDAVLDAFLSVRYPPAVTVLHRQGVPE